MTDSPLAGAEWAGFLNAMRFRGDDTDFLVAADWLDDQDGPEFAPWAEFVRCQVAQHAASRSGARMHVYTDSCDCEHCRPERRASVLFDHWGQIWIRHCYPSAPDALHLPARLGHFERGFPATAEVSFDDFRLSKGQQIGELWLRLPIHKVTARLSERRLLNWLLEITSHRPVPECPTCLQLTTRLYWSPSLRYIVLGSQPNIDYKLLVTPHSVIPSQVAVGINEVYPRRELLLPWPVDSLRLLGT
jgi:uncharacterized protein (TIGR02996 family)